MIINLDQHICIHVKQKVTYVNIYSKSNLYRVYVKNKAVNVYKFQFIIFTYLNGFPVIQPLNNVTNYCKHSLTENNKYFFLFHYS